MDHNIHHRGLTPQSYNKPEQLNEMSPGFVKAGLGLAARAGRLAARVKSAAPTNARGETGKDIINRINSEISSRTPAQRTAARADAMKNPNIQAGIKARLQAKVTADIAKANVEPSKDQVDAAVKKHETERETARTTPGTSAYKADQQSSRLRDQTDKIRQGMRDDRLRHQAKVGKGAYKAARPFTLPDTPQGNRDRQRAALAAKRGRRDQRMQNQQSLSRRGPDAGPVETGARSDGQKSALKKMADMNKAWDAKTPDEKRAVRAKQKAARIARIAARAAKP